MTPLEITKRKGGARVAQVSRRQAVRPVRLSRATRRAHQERRRHPADDLRRQRVCPRLRGNTRSRGARCRSLGSLRGPAADHGLRRSEGGMHAKVKKWIDYMMGELALGSVGVLGFCLGGRYALMAAAQDKRAKACAAAYPSIENPRLPNQEQDAVALAADIRCPVHVIQPGHDHVATVETYAALRETLQKRAAPTMWQYYPDAEHGFMHRKEPAANPAATVIASPQLVAFLKACLS